MYKIIITATLIATIIAAITEEAPTIYKAAIEVRTIQIATTGTLEEHLKTLEDHNMEHLSKTYRDIEEASRVVAINELDGIIKDAENNVEGSYSVEGVQSVIDEAQNGTLENL